MNRWYARFAVGVATMAFLVGRAGIANADTIIIDVKSNFFSPSEVLIKTGDTVRWVIDEGSHTTTSSTGLWDSGVLSSGSMFEYTFNDSGDFSYTCTLHFQCCNMAGTVHVQNAPAPVSVTGYSADVISDMDPSARFAQPFHAGTFAWFEAGAVDDNGTQHNDGLPAGLIFLSATGSGAIYQIQPANANNVLQLSAGQTGTFMLTTPAAYGTLYVIASSGDGAPSSAGSGTINFADGSQQAFSYNSFDWCNGSGGLHPEAVLTGPNGRADVGPNGTAFVYNQDCDFQIYETIIAIDPSHAGVAIASIDFTSAPDAFLSNVFGVSGQ
jgi:plastocyanin